MKKRIFKNYKKIGTYILLGLLFVILIFVINQKFILKEKSNIVLPLQLKIPSINIDAKIESLGLTKDGEVDAPSGPKNVGWYNLGPIPGGIGNAIIDGHSGWKGNTPAVFDQLNKLRIGDKIYIENENGQTIVFIVYKIKIYKTNEDYTDVFVSNDNKAHLNLITCTGLWDERQKSSPDRLVIFTNKE